MSGPVSVTTTNRQFEAFLEDAAMTDTEALELEIACRDSAQAQAERNAAVGKLAEMHGHGLRRVKTLCLQCGPDVALDEDGCCATCGAGAVGPWLEKVRVEP